MNKNLPNNNVFCMFPWVHVYVESDGSTRPCCIGNYGMTYGSVKDKKMIELLNEPVAKTLRKNMIEGVKSEICKQCYIAEEVNEQNSLRQFANHRFGHHYDEVIKNTDQDGTLKDIKLRYIDIRLSNICNFKCRSCSYLFSSSIAAEEKKTYPNKIVFQKPRNDQELLNEIMDHSEHIEQIYFAGGEPLITDDHYFILEELIKRKKTNILLRYNSNCSNLNYKNKDIVALWKNFGTIEFQASIDHYGERAEYIRNGTDWAVVESNLKHLTSMPNLSFSYNTVLSIFNYTTLLEFYTYMIEKGLVKKNYHMSLYRLIDPTYMCVQQLPEQLKLIGRQKNTSLINYINEQQYKFANNVEDAISFAESKTFNNIWPKEFQSLIIEKDQIRNESFIKTFPELTQLLD